MKQLIRVKRIFSSRQSAGVVHGEGGGVCRMLMTVGIGVLTNIMYAALKAVFAFRVIDPLKISNYTL